jgi:dephospho-CoA kinase
MIIGLTGGIGMGKTTVAKFLRRLGFPVFSADKAVHEVLKRGGAAFVPVAKAFPETLKRGRINRELLGQAVFGNPRKLGRLEDITHPLVKKAEDAFLQEAHKAKARAVVLEIPLLFETKAERRCDITLCVSAPFHVQRARVLPRKNMNEKKFYGILARQKSDAEKCKMADYVIPTGTSPAETKEYIRALFHELGLLGEKGRPRRNALRVRRSRCLMKTAS